MYMAHTCIRVEDLEASLDFYEKAFGFKETRRKDFPDDDFTLVYLALPGDDYELELTYNYGHSAYRLGDGYGHIAIASDDLEGLHEKQKKAGIPIGELSALPGEAPHYYFVTDPDGYKIEVIRSKK